MPCVSRSLQPVALRVLWAQVYCVSNLNEYNPAHLIPRRVSRMRSQGFCGKCGARLTRAGWRTLFRARLCDDCARGARRIDLALPFGVVVVIAVASFSVGRYLRPSPPPLIIQRAANSPLSDSPIKANDSPGRINQNQKRGTSEIANASSRQTGTTPELLYICGARTKKGTPCKRRVHFAGERCYQHKGMPAMLPLDKLAAKSK